jgi:hypothetical protein
MSKEIAKNEAKVPEFLKQDAGLGNENVTADDFVTPRLKLLQALSDEVTRGKAGYDPDARAGQFYDTVAKKGFDEMYVLNLFQRTEWLAFKKKTAPGDPDFQGAHPTREAAIQHLESQGLNVEDYDIEISTVHTLAAVDPETGDITGVYEYAFNGYNGRPNRSSSEWNTAIAMRAPVRFGSVWKIEPKLVSNSKGSWFVLSPSFVRHVNEKLYHEAKELYERVKAVHTN